MSIIERIQVLLSENEQIANDLCRVIGIGSGQFTMWKKRGTDPPAKYIPAIADYLGVTERYLITGVGKRKNPEEITLLREFRKLNTFGRTSALAAIKGYTQDVVFTIDDSSIVFERKSDDAGYTERLMAYLKAFGELNE